MRWLLLISAAINIACVVVLVLQRRYITRLWEALGAHPVRVTKTIDGKRVTTETELYAVPRRVRRHQKETHTSIESLPATGTGGAS